MDSMGQKVNTRTRKMGGSMVWFPRGLALERYSTRIRPEVEGILNNIEIPEGEKLIIKLYMIGRSEQKANPMIMICCSDKATRKEAEALIRESGLLDRHENSGFGLGSTGFPLESTFLPRPLGKETHSESNPSTKEFMRTEIYGLTEPGIGRKLCFVTSSRSGQTVQYATGGPIMRLGDQFCQLTVAHAMKHDLGPELPTEHELDSDECEFDGQSDEEDDEHLILSRASLSPRDSMRDVDPDSDQQDSQPSSIYSDPNPETPSLESLKISETRQPLKSVRMGQIDEDWKSSARLCWFSTPVDYNRELDYFLIALPTEPSELAKRTNQITIDDSPKSRTIQVDNIASVRNQDISILVITSRGPIHGTILSHPTSFKAAGSSSFQQLLTVLLSKGLMEGDSGSAIIHAQTGHFYGHVVLGFESDCVAYVLSSPDIMANIIFVDRQLPSFYRADEYERSNSPPTAQFHHTITKSGSTLSHDTAPSSHVNRSRKTVRFGEDTSSRTRSLGSSNLWSGSDASSSSKGTTYSGAGHSGRQTDSLHETNLLREMIQKYLHDASEAKAKAQNLAEQLHLREDKITALNDRCAQLNKEKESLKIKLATLEKHEGESRALHRALSDARREVEKLKTEVRRTHPESQNTHDESEFMLRY